MLTFLFQCTKKIEDRLWGNSGDEQEGSFEPVQELIKKLYSDKKLVGPVGERPIHVCALAAAKYQDLDQDMTEGILDGIRLYIDKEKKLYCPYGKDYCGAVGQDREKGVGDKMHEEKGFGDQKPPFYDKISSWFEIHFNKALARSSRGWLGCFPRSIERSSADQDKVVLDA
jgi:hypothetical protein